MKGAKIHMSVNEEKTCDFSHTIKFKDSKFKKSKLLEDLVI